MCVGQGRVIDFILSQRLHISRLTRLICEMRSCILLIVNSTLFSSLHSSTLPTRPFRETWREAQRHHGVMKGFPAADSPDCCSVRRFMPSLQPTECEVKCMPLEIRNANLSPKPRDTGQVILSLPLSFHIYKTGMTTVPFTFCNEADMTDPINLA